MLEKLNTWHHTRPGLTVAGLIELGLVYGFASWAIDSGSLRLYLATLVSLIGCLQNTVALIGSFAPRRRR